MRAPGLAGGHGPEESEGRKFEIVDLPQFSVEKDTETSRESDDGVRQEQRREGRRN